MTEPSMLRLYLLRATYLFVAVGLGLMIWPGLLGDTSGVTHMGGVVRSVLGAVSLLALLGVRYPLAMLPLLFFELLWKSIWLLAFGLPLWLGQALTAGTRETLRDNLIGLVLFLVMIPWRYVWQRYVRGPGDPWHRRTTVGSQERSRR